MIFTFVCFFKYAGTGILLSIEAIPVLVRASLSSFIPRSEIGKALAVLGILESVMPLVGVPLANSIYAATLGTFPGCAYLFSALLDFIILIGFR